MTLRSKNLFCSIFYTLSTHIMKERPELNWECIYFKINIDGAQVTQTRAQEVVSINILNEMYDVRSSKNTYTVLIASGSETRKLLEQNLGDLNAQIKLLQ